MKFFYILLAVAAVLLAACRTKKADTPLTDQSGFKIPAVAESIPDTFVNFGKQRIDNYFWLKDKENPKVIEFLNAENEYTDQVMLSTKDLQETIFNEIVGRIKEDDESYPTLRNGYYYYSRTEKGKQYQTHCRRKDSMDAPEEIIFDINQMAEEKSAFIFRGYSISPDNRKAAYFFNETGSYAEFILRIKDLGTGEDIGFEINGAASVAWANDSETVFYSTINNTLRSNKIWRHKLNETAGTEVYEETDQKFSAYVSGSKTRQFIFISSASSTTSEERFVSADNPAGAFQLFLPRIQDVEYDVYPHKKRFFVHYKDNENLNGLIYEVPLEGYKEKSNWKELVPHSQDARIESVDVLQDYLSVQFRRNGLSEIEILPLADDAEPHLISFPEPVYSVSLGGNPEYKSTTIRYSYSSLNRPSTLFEYDIPRNKSEILKVQEIPSGFNPANYNVERLWATAADGVKVPIAVVYKKGLKKDGSNPALLYAYGSYGINMDANFRASMYSLIDRGFVFAIAQIRGGSELGEQWYEDGKMLKKKNTFSDFISCSELLIQEKYTSAQKLAAMGGSAGGLLMGAVANMRPDLYQTIVAQVPFVDVINTMLDESLPLTTGEYEEWGNPNEEEYYNYILSYSPYDNIKAQDYPNILVTGGINDSQVLFHEPAKYVAKLRKMKTDSNLLLLHMNMESGHGGATGRYDALKEIAFEYAFILNRVGIDK